MVMATQHCKPPVIFEKLMVKIYNEDQGPTIANTLIKVRTKGNVLSQLPRLLKLWIGLSVGKE